MNSWSEEGEVVVPSSSAGRFALGTRYGPDLTSGLHCEISLNGSWITGSVEYAAQNGGYYFRAGDGSICGLCVNMRVRVLTSAH